MPTTKVFWLHVKKAGGTSLRDEFAKYFYVGQEDRYTHPLPFVAVPKEQWNDVLNNFRIPLGHYDYKRMQFAKKFLYSEEEFRAMYKFVVVRDPYERIFSAWKYLFRCEFPDKEYNKMKRSFTYFLEQLPKSFEVRFQQIYHHGYIGLHAAPVWADITDEDGTLLVDQVVRLEHFNEDIKTLNDKFGFQIGLTIHKNKGSDRGSIERFLTPQNIEIINHIYADDIRHLGYPLRDPAKAKKGALFGLSKR
jgi:Sulfotransferase family